MTVGIEDGSSQTVSLASLADNQSIQGSGFSGTTLTIGIEDGSSETVDLSPLADNQSIQNLGLSGTTLTVGIEDGSSQTVNLSTLADDDVSVTNVKSGNTIATISEPGITAVDINETITSLSQNTGTGVISYTNEDGGAAETANVVSGDSGNELTVGADGGAKFTITPTDMDEGGIGSPTLETTVQEVIDAIAPITSKAARIFYPPSIAVDASANGSFSIDLYAQYIAQFGSPTVGSTGAPAAVPTYTATELYYYVTYADPAVFNTGTMAIDVNGNLSYTIIGQPADYNSLINVVFVVK